MLLPGVDRVPVGIPLEDGVGPHHELAGPRVVGVVVRRRSGRARDAVVLVERIERVVFAACRVAPAVELDVQLAGPVEGAGYTGTLRVPRRVGDAVARPHDMANRVEVVVVAEVDPGISEPTDDVATLDGRGDLADVRLALGDRRREPVGDLLAVPRGRVSLANRVQPLDARVHRAQVEVLRRRVLEPGHRDVRLKFDEEARVAKPSLLATDRILPVRVDVGRIRRVVRCDSAPGNAGLVRSDRHAIGDGENRCATPGALKIESLVAFTDDPQFVFSDEPAAGHSQLGSH